MRINKYVALATGLSRRTADAVVTNGQVSINDRVATPGDDVVSSDTVTYQNQVLVLPEEHTTILFNKPVGYVCSRNGQGSKTLYDLLPDKYASLKTVGRLDKDSSGLILLTNDGELANELSHPSNNKQKQYHIHLNKPLEPLHQQMITDYGVMLEDGVSRFVVTAHNSRNELTVVLTEGRNRQIRRTFAALGYSVIKLHRISFGPYQLGDLGIGKTRELL